MQKMLGAEQPDYGHILDGMLVEDGSVIPIHELIQPKIEPEIAFVLDRDLKGPGGVRNSGARGDSFYRSGA